MLKFRNLSSFEYVVIGLFSKKQATRYVKSTKKKTSSLHKLSVYTSGLLVIGVFIAVYWLMSGNRFPITAVKVIGERQHVSSTQLHNMIFPHIQAGFFSVKVSNLQQQLLLLPWIKQVDIRRVWPGQLVVRISEHKPAAIWNQTSILSADGDIITPSEGDIKTLNLPHFLGPQNKQELVWQQYLSMEEAISGLHLHISTLKLAERGAWEIVLNNGVRVILGTQDIDIRLNRFVKAYKKEFSRKSNNISYVDLRYTSGMAVGWKQG